MESNRLHCVLILCAYTSFMVPHAWGSERDDDKDEQGVPDAIVSDRDLHRMLLVTDWLDKDLKVKLAYVLANGGKFFGRLNGIAKTSRSGAEISAICSIYLQAKGNKSVPLRSIREIIHEHPRKHWSDKMNERALSAAAQALGELGELEDEEILWRILREKQRLRFLSRAEWDNTLLISLGQLGGEECQERLARWVEEQSLGMTQAEVRVDSRFNTAYQAIGTIEYRKFLNGLPKP